MVEPVKPVNVAIVGGGPGCKAIMDMIFAEKLSQLHMKLIGVASTNPEAVGYRYAQEMGIYVTRDYRDLYELEGLDMIIELTRQNELANEIHRTKPAHVRVIDHVAARVFWDVFRIEEESLAERQRSEEITKLAFAELNQIFETSANGMRVIDKNFNVLRVNESFATLSGVSKEQAVGEKCYNVFGGQRCHTPSCPLTLILSGEQRVEEDAEKQRKDGSTVSCIVTATALRDAEGEFIGIVEDLKDISFRKQAEETVDAERRRLFSLLESLPAYVCLIARDYVVRFANREFRESFGDPRGKLCYEVLGGHETPCKDCQTFQVLHTESPTEWEWTARNGKSYHIYDYPFTDVDGAPLIMELGIDVTERKRLEAQLLQAQKMEAIGTLAGGIAHDFNNLLMGIQGHTSLMSLSTGREHPHEEHLKGIEEMVKKGADLTGQLLGFARGGKYQVTPSDLNRLVEKSADMFGRTRREITIHSKYEPSISPVEVDQGQIEQVLLNLYVNAWQVMPRGGDLYIETSNVVLDEHYTHPLDVKPGKYVKISVTDTGAGMDKATQQRIFDPFFTTKEMGRGTGLGLASAYGIVKNHGGIISVDSEAGRGSTFNIYLPASEKAVPMKEEEVPEEILGGQGCVLLADDEEVILKVGGDMLKKIGYSVYLARSGREALDIYKERCDEIDIVILDMIMPDMGGGEAHDRIKEINTGARVLLSSGYSINGEAAEIMERGCDGFLQKPFDMRGLSAKIKEVLKG